MKTPYLDQYIKTLEEDAKKGNNSFYENCKLRELKKIKKQLLIACVVDTLPADQLIESLGEPEQPNEYILKTDNGIWWIEDRNIGNGEPLKQWLTDKPISG